MANLLVNPVIADSSVDTITVPQRGRWMFSLGFGDLDDPDDADSEDFETADCTVRLGGRIIKDEDGTAVSAITSGVQFLLDLPKGAVIEVTTANVTSVCRITCYFKLVEAY